MILLHSLPLQLLGVKQMTCQKKYSIFSIRYKQSGKIWQGVGCRLTKSRRQPDENARCRYCRLGDTQLVFLYALYQSGALHFKQLGTATDIATGFF